MGKNEKRFLGALLLGATAALVITGWTSLSSDETSAEDNTVTGSITAVRLDLPVGDLRIRIEDGEPARCELEHGPCLGQEHLISGAGNNSQDSLVVPVRRLSGVHSSLI
jgi:hypothetical protein